MLQSIIQSLGITYGFLIIVSGALAISNSLITVFKAESGFERTGHLAILLLPIWIGLFASLHGLISVLYEFNERGIALDNTNAASLMFTVLASTFVGFGFSLTSYIVLVVASVQIPTTTAELTDENGP